MLQREQGWEFRTARKHRLLATLDPAYVRDTAERCCGDLMEGYFAAVSWDPVTSQTHSAT
jgi:hypothetical protein